MRHENLDFAEEFAGRNSLFIKHGETECDQKQY